MTAGQINELWQQQWTALQRALRQHFEFSDPYDRSGARHEASRALRRLAKIVLMMPVNASPDKQLLLFPEIDSLWPEDLFVGR